MSSKAPGTLAFSNILYKGAWLLVGYVNIILLSRLLGPSGIGEISLFLSTAVFGVYLLGGSLESGIIYHYAGRLIPQQRFIPLILTLVASQLVLLALVLGLLHPFTGLHLYSGWMSRPLGNALLILVVLSTICSNYFVAMLNGKKTFGPMNRAVLAANLAVFLLLIVCGLARLHHGWPTDRTILGLYLASSILQALFTAGCFLLVSPGPKWDTGRLGRDILDIFHYAKWVWLSNILTFLALRLDFWLVSYFCGKQQLGIYAQAARVGQLFFILPAVIASTILPFAIQQKEGFSQRIVPFFKCILWMNLLVAILLCAGAFILFPLLFGRGFAYSANCFIALMPGIFCFSLTNALTAYFLGTRRLGPVLWESVICIFIVVGGDLLVIPRYHILGAALVSTVGYTVAAIYTIAVFTKRTQLRLVDLIRIGKKDLQALVLTVRSLPGTR